MVAKTLTISMSQEDFDYLQEDTLLSPSKIFQVALEGIKNNRKNLNEQVKKLQIVNDRLYARIKELEKELSYNVKV